MPNAFTPSSDGINDYIELFMKGVSTYKLTVKDRLGRKMYDSDDYDDWAGEYKGSIAKSDNYPYVLEYTTVTGKSYTKKGKVSLINNIELRDLLRDYCIDNYTDCVFGLQWQGDTLPLKTVAYSQEYFPACQE